MEIQVLKTGKSFLISIVIVALCIVASVAAGHLFVESGRPDVLFVAIENGEAKSVQKALDEGVNVNKLTKEERNYDGQWEDNPLMLAVEYDNRWNDVCKCLIENGANVNYVNDDGESILMLVVRNCDYEKTKMLIDAGADVTYKKSSKIEEIDIMNSLIITGDRDEWHIPENTYKIFKLLTAKGLKISIDDFEQQFISKGNYIKGMKTLELIYDDYQRNKQYIKNENASILDDIYLNNTKAITSYMNEYKQIEDLPPYIIGCLVANDNVEALKCYYEKGGDLEISSERYDGGQTLLMIGAAFDSYDCVEFLLEHGADIDRESDLYGVEEYLNAEDYAFDYDSENVLKLFEAWREK